MIWVCGLALVVAVIALVVALVVGNRYVALETRVRNHGVQYLGDLGDLGGDRLIVDTLQRRVTALEGETQDQAIPSGGADDDLGEVLRGHTQAPTQMGGWERMAGILGQGHLPTELRLGGADTVYTKKPPEPPVERPTSWSRVGEDPPDE